MDYTREGQSETGGGQQKKARAIKSTPEVTHDLREDCKGRHTIEDTRHLYCNENPKVLKRNRNLEEGGKCRLSWTHAGDAELYSSIDNW